MEFNSKQLEEAKRIRATILALILRQPGLTVDEISAKVNRSTKQCERHLKKLIANGFAHSQLNGRKYHYYPGVASKLA